MKDISTAKHLLRAVHGCLSGELTLPSNRRSNKGHNLHEFCNFLVTCLCLVFQMFYSLCRIQYFSVPVGTKYRADCSKNGNVFGQYAA